MEELIGALGAFWDAIPRPASAALVLAGGWLAAIALRFILSRGLSLARFDKAGEKTGLSEFLRKGRVKYGPSRLVGVIAYWLTLMAAFLAAARRLDAGIAAALSARLSAALPEFATALVVAIIGSILVSFLANFVLTIARNAAVPNASLLAKAIKYAGIALVIALTLEQLGIGKTIISGMLQIVFAAAAFALALAFGLGCKDLAKETMLRFLRDLREKERSRNDGDLEG